ncbi:MAG TPA: hypothetical protein VFX96_12475 [Pyrinomonadaceae bacterium]|nr:hypothetical protein [Pyrinomonadaceae bacterium]
MKKFLAAFALLVFSVGAVNLSARAAQQNDPGVTPNGVIGEVVAVDANAKQVFVKTDMGSVVTVATADNTIIRRNPPGETKLDKAVPMTLAELVAGDRVFARGALSDDRKSVMGRALIVNTKADLEKKREAERAEWKARGVVGVVAAVDPATKEITLNTRTPEGPKPVKLAVAGDAVKFRRYAPDSVKFSDAKPSTFEEVKVGDQLRAKGERSADGATFTPEEIVTGTFRTTLGTVSAVDAAKNEITVKQMQGNAVMTVVVRPDSMLKRVPAEFAAMMGGGGGAPGAGGAAPGAAGGQQRVVVQQHGSGGATPPAGGAPGAGGGMARRMGDMAEMLERLPPTTVAELKAGDMIVVSSTVGADPTRVTAIQLVAGIEPIVAMMARRAGGGGGGGPAGGGGGGAGAPNPFGFGIGQP